MFNRGLSFDQAPPFTVVLRFFLTVPVFGLLVGLAILGADRLALGNWDTPQMVAIVHLVVLGIAGMAMVGALFQMLPVIAGAPIRASEYHARWIHAFMALGVLMLSGAFWLGKPFLLHPALALLLGSMGFGALLMLTKLLRVENKTPSVMGMIVALLSLGLGLIFALMVTLSFMGVQVGIDPEILRTLHLHFMLFGWIGVLVMAVAFQVIEMFYVTPAYPKRFREWVPMALLALLVLEVPVAIFFPPWRLWIDGAVGLLLMGFAVLTIHRLMRRKRPVADATVWFWRTGMGALLASVLLFYFSFLESEGPFLGLGALFFALFFLSVINAMSYKIIPFLVWFHLNAKGVMETPMMGDIIAASMMRWHLWLFWALIGCGVLAPFLPIFWYAMGVLFLIISLLHGSSLYKAASVYFQLKDKGTL